VPLRIVADKGSLHPGFRWQGFVVRLVCDGTARGLRRGDAIRCCRPPPDRPRPLA
jgi:hypothetical protein